MKYNPLYILIIGIILMAFSYIIINFKKVKNSYNILIGIINLWCITVFLFVIIQTDFNSLWALFIFILSVIFHFASFLKKGKTIKIFSIGIVWVFTIFSGIMCFSGMGAIILFLLQPISYLFGFYLLTINYDKIYIPIYINLVISWIISFGGILDLYSLINNYCQQHIL